MVVVDADVARKLTHDRDEPYHRDEGRDRDP